MVRGMSGVGRTRGLRRLGATCRGAVLVGLTLTVASLPAAAAAAAAQAVPPPRVLMGGDPVALRPAPVLLHGVPYVSVQALSALLGVPVTWNPKTDTIEVGIPVATAHSFVFQGVRYAVTGLQERAYTGVQSTSGEYWIVSYELTNTTDTAVDIPATQPGLVLLGPRGAQYLADASLSGPTAGTLNPHLSFSSYAVFNVPTGASPAGYALGFDAYRATAKGFQPAPLGAALPASSAATHTTQLDATYTVSNLWDSDAQDVLLRALVRTSAVLPDLTAPSFDPTTSFWIVDFSIDNPGANPITLQASQFSLQFGDGATVPAYPVSDLPGYVPPNNLFGASGGSAAGGTGAAASSAGVTVPPGQVWSGALLFEIPATISTAQPGFAISVNGQQRVLPLTVCQAGVCPPVEQ
jgi:hypothetical protein